MQLHELKRTTKKNTSKRVGRGGKRGTYSGHGSKGQKSRAGARIRPGFRGGDNPFWKLFPKQRGATKKIEVKHTRFRVANRQGAIVNLGNIAKHFKTGETVARRSLVRRGLVATSKKGIKVLSDGELDKKLKFSSDLTFSKSTLVKIEKSGSTVIESLKK